MISVNMKAPHEIVGDIARRVKEKRLSLNLSQQTLSDRSGVSYGTLKKFERTGQISLESIVKLALSLGSLDDFEHLFVPLKSIDALSLDELIKDTPRRKRGRK
jgi:transcriptional regulator with XRE-family HTH domain